MFSGALKTHIRSMHSEIKEAFIQKIIDYIEGKKEKFLNGSKKVSFYNSIYVFDVYNPSFKILIARGVIFCSTSFIFPRGETILSQI